MARLAGLLAILVAASTGATSGAPDVGATEPCAAPTTLPAPPSDRPLEVLRIRVLPGLTSAAGSLTVSFAPPVATDRLVFRLWPNSPYYARRGARLTVGTVTEEGRRLPTSRPNPTTLVVRRPVAAHERVRVSMAWTLRLPTRPGLQLHGGRSARLVSFYPMLAWDGDGWATDPPFTKLEYFFTTSPTADFDVRLSVPPGVRVLASGEDLGNGRWRARAVRDFALAIGSWKIATASVRAPRPVHVTVGLEAGSGITGYSVRDYLAATTRALRFYAQRFGDYPWSTYTLAVMKDFTSLSGNAYPTIGFLGDSSFVLTPHETAHQWFYSLVGNNQSRDPWISEGLATWAQTGPEESLGIMLATPIPPTVRNRIGEPMSFWDPRGFETLRLGVYVQTVQALASLGAAADVDCALRRFVVANAYRVAVPLDLLESLRPSFPDAEQKLRAWGAHF
jgi:hypothetical protein